MERIANGGARLSGNELRVSGSGAALFVSRNEEGSSKIILSPNSSLSLYSIYYGGSKIKNSFELGAFSTLSIIEIFHSGVAISNSVPLENGNCTVRLLAKGAVDGFSSYRAMIAVGRSAKNCSVDVEERALLLTPDSKAELVPGLDIRNSEVNARHAAAMGGLDSEQVFYLMSRGLGRADAEKEMVSGFLSRETSEIKEKFSYQD